MAYLDLWFFFSTLTGSLLGGWHLCWARCDHHSSRGLWARRLGVCALLCLGATGLAAAGLRSSWVVPLGLLAGLLVVVMLWENPHTSLEPDLNKKR